MKSKKEIEVIAYFDYQIKKYSKLFQKLWKTQKNEFIYGQKIQFESFLDEFYEKANNELKEYDLKRICKSIDDFKKMNNASIENAFTVLDLIQNFIIDEIIKHNESK